MNQKEIWKDIPGYEGLYQVSNLGRAKSLDREINNSYQNGVRLINGRILNPGINKKNYHVVCLCKNSKRKTFYVHQLVMIVFANHKPDGTNKYVVDHKNGDKSNNKKSNLQIITNRENLSKGRKNCTSKYTGTSWHKSKSKWQSAIRINKKLIHLGYFTNELDASNAYQNELKTLGS